jgi:hypothetical protein
MVTATQYYTDLLIAGHFKDAKFGLINIATVGHALINAFMQMNRI